MLLLCVSMCVCVCLAISTEVYSLSKCRQHAHGMLLRFFLPPHEARAGTGQPIGWLGCPCYARPSEQINAQSGWQLQSGRSSVSELLSAWANLAPACLGVANFSSPE